MQANEELERYIRNLSSPEDALLAELESESNMRVVQPQMIPRILSWNLRILTPYLFVSLQKDWVYQLILRTDMNVELTQQ